jgi:hypothetical protein
MHDEFTIEWWLNRFYTSNEAMMNEKASKADEYFLTNKETYLAPIIIDFIGRECAEKLAEILSVLTRG